MYYTLVHVVTFICTTWSRAVHGGNGRPRTVGRETYTMLYYNIIF